MLDAYYTGLEEFLRTGDHKQLARFVGPDSNFAAFNVYRNGYLKTCTDALASSYPVVRSLVGEDYFRSMARSYIEIHPPEKSTLVGYGHRFSDYLRSRAAEHGLPYLADAALIDAAWLVSFFAGSTKPLTAADIESFTAQGTDLSTVQVGLTPSVQLVNLDYDLVGIWALIREQGFLTERAEVRCVKSKAMVWRREGQIHVKALDHGEAAFLSEISGIATLEEAAQHAFAVDADFDLPSTFAALLDNEIIQMEC